MGQPGASRRQVTVISSDDEDEPKSEVQDADPDARYEPEHRGTGRLKSVNKTRSRQLPTPVTSTQEKSSQKSPAKPKSSKAKSKTAVKDAPKPNSRPIHSFFNAATQRQQLSQPSASPEKLPTPNELTEAINDDSGEDRPGHAFSKGSSTALAMRKRKVQQGQDFDEQSCLPPPATQKFRKTSDSGKTPSFTVSNDDKRPWTEQFAPIDLSELAVHKRKVNDVRQWLESAISGRRQKVLVLKGAAGTGKTTTVNLLAKDLRLDVVEWRSPAGADLSAEGTASSAAQFEDFVARAGKAVGLTFSSDGNHPAQPSTAVSGEPQNRVDNARQQLLLVEEYPSTFSRTSAALQSFRSAILTHVSAPPVKDGTATPIVMVISETLLSTTTAAADSFTAHRLLGPELANHPYVNLIEFNPVAPTILTKALEGIVVKEARKSGRRKTPGPLVLKQLAETGDVRSAVSSLEFLCLRGDDGDTWSSRVTFTKPKKSKSEPALTKSEEEALKLITNRESSLGIFHAVGKVVYNKRIQPTNASGIVQPPAWLPQSSRTTLPETDVDTLIDELGTDTSTFIAALHENYALSCGASNAEDTLDSLSGCADSVSDADLLGMHRFSFGTRAFSGSATDTLRQDEMAFQVAVRGLLFNLPHPVHRSVAAGGNRSDAHRMFYPTSLRLWKKQEEIESTLDLLTEKMQAGVLSQHQLLRSTQPRTAVSGVESWKRSSTLDQQKSTLDPALHGDNALVCTHVSRIEMLLERLPYLAHILNARHGPNGAPIADQILSVCSVQGLGPGSADEDQDGEDGQDSNVVPEQWTTDHPDADQSKSQQSRVRHSGRKGKTSTEGGGLQIPVESDVQRLVLEDDDIVDD